MDPIHFQCPVCKASLTLPAATPGHRGPCPHCHEDIIGPDPARGFPARPAQLDNSPPEVVDAVQEEPKRRPAKPESSSRPQGNPNQKDTPGRPGYSGSSVFIACLICTVLAFVGGLLIGGSSRNREATPPIWNPRTPPKAPTPQPGEAKPDGPIKPPAEDPPQAEETASKPPPNRPNSRSTLEAFLMAKTWNERCQHAVKSLDEETTVEAIDYSDLKAISESDSAHSFQLVTRDHPRGLPVILKLDTKGWGVEWEHFNEHNEDRFKRFASGEGPSKASFHLLVFPDATTASHPASAFASFRLSPAMRDREQVAFVKRGTLAHLRLKEALDRQQASQQGQDIISRAGETDRIHLSFNRNTQDQPFLLVEDFPARPGSTGSP